MRIGRIFVVLFLLNMMRQTSFILYTHLLKTHNKSNNLARDVPGATVPTMHNDDEGNASGMQWPIFVLEMIPERVNLIK